MSAIFALSIINHEFGELMVDNNLEEVIFLESKLFQINDPVDVNH